VDVPAGALAVADSVVVDTTISNGWRARIYGQPSFSQLPRLQVGLRQPGIKILDPGCTAKTYPHFFQDLEKVRRNT